MLDPKKKLEGKDQSIQNKIESAQKVQQGEKILKFGLKQTEDYQIAVQLFNDALNILQQGGGISISLQEYAKIYNLRGKAKLQLKLYDQAYKDLFLAVKNSPQNPNYLADKGEYYFQINEYQKGIKEFTEAIQHKIDSNCKDNCRYFMKRGMLYEKLKQFNEAVEDLETAIKLNKDIQSQNYFLSLVSLGISYRSLNQIDKSIESLKIACEIKNTDDSALNNLGVSYFQNHQFEKVSLKAFYYFKQAISLNEQNASFYNNAGLAEFELEDYQKSIIDFNLSIQLNNSNSETFYNRGNAYFFLKYGLILNTYCLDNEMKLKQLNELEQAIQMFEKSLKQNGAHIDSMFHLGITYQKKKSNQNALQQYDYILNNFEFSIESDSLKSSIYENRGIVYQQLNQHELAIKDFKLAIFLSPKDNNLYFLKGISNMEIGLLDEAIKDFEKAIELNSTNPQLHINMFVYIYQRIFCGLGKVYRLKKLNTKALYYLNTAIAKLENTLQFYIERSNIYCDLKDYLNAIDDLKKAEEIDSQNSEIFYKRGKTYFLNQEFEKSVKDLHTAIDLQEGKNYDQADLYYILGIDLETLGLFSFAIAPLSRAIQFNSDKAQYWHERAKCNQFIGDYESSLNDFNTVIQLQPNNSHAFFGRGFAHKALKQYKKAADDFIHAQNLEPNNPKFITNFTKLGEIHFIQLCNPGEEKSD